MLGERGFKVGHFFTAVSLGFIASLIGCRVAGFAYGLTWRAMAEITISDNAGNVLSDSFVGAGEFSLFGGRNICVFDGRLLNKDTR